MTAVKEEYTNEYATIVLREMQGKNGSEYKTVHQKLAGLLIPQFFYIEERGCCVSSNILNSKLKGEKKSLGGI